MAYPRQLFGPPPRDRSSWADALVSLVAPATRLAALGPERLPVHASSNDRGSAWFELISRPLWGMAAYHAGGFGAAERQWEELRLALTAALDPKHPWFIGPPMDLEQRLVEAAAVGYALAAAPAQMWDPLSGRQQEHLTDWLSAAANAVPHDNNWCFFPVLAAAGLQARGVTVNHQRLESHLDRIDDFAVARGWYSDGAGTLARPGVHDYYTPFGFHFYGLLLGSLGSVDVQRSRAYRERAIAFAKDFQHWFAADGAAVPFGRSLSYRFAQASFWSMLAAADVPALEWPPVRSLAEANLDWWWRQPVCEEDGRLSVGYAYPNQIVAEEYLAAGSPYWGTKIFSALAAPQDHPFWTANRTSVTEPASLSVQESAGMLLSRDANGDVVALSAQNPPAFNPRGAAAKYSKFAYSTLAGFSVSCGESGYEQGAFDCTLALSDDGEHWRTRDGGQSTIDGATIVLVWKPWPDVSIETRLTPQGDGHLREHNVFTGRVLETAEGGFCTPFTSWGRVPAESAAGAGFARAADSEIFSEITCTDSLRSGEIVQPVPGTHLMFRRTLLPVLRHTLAPGTHRLTSFVRVSRR